jgi:hypothetical protein
MYYMLDIYLFFTKTGPIDDPASVLGGAVA